MIQGAYARIQILPSIRYILEPHFAGSSLLTCLSTERA